MVSEPHDKNDSFANPRPNASYPTPINESERILELKRYRILDTAPEQLFDDIVRLAKGLFDVDTALISLVDSDRQWFKAKEGIDVCETDRNIAFCAHAIVDNHVMVVGDSLEDRRFESNPLVTGPPYIRFYAGAPLRTPSGYNVGTLCIFDSKPRDNFNLQRQTQLLDLANLVRDKMTMRLHDLESRDRALDILSIADEMTRSAEQLDSQSLKLSDMSINSSRKADLTLENVRMLTVTGTEVNDKLSSIFDQITLACQDIEHSSSAMRDMGLIISGIAKVANHINLIATESKILSLNASIEAARNFGSNQLFGTIAQEVNQLAVRTSAAARNITVELTSVSNGMNRRVHNYESLSTMIEQLAKATGDMSRQVNSQMTANNRISAEVAGIAQTASEVYSQASEVSSASERLQGYATALKHQARILIED